MKPRARSRGPEVTYNVWNRAEHYIKQLNIELNMCWTLHIAGPMANDTTLKSPMANEHCRLYTVVHLTCWPTSRSKWSQMVVCAVNWGRWLPVQLITDYSYRQPNQAIQRWCVRTIQEDTNYWLLIADQHRCCLFQPLPTQLTPPARWVV